MLYRSNLPVMVLAHGDNHHAAVTIPEGETFRLLGPDQDDRFCVVQYREEDFLVFESDLRTLCEAVSRKEGPRDPLPSRSFAA
jgi:hypothetical protein